jgi:EAL domain-containing protein (putative c-di-GMP-specific phosphodiesterase class I)/GGDEF domain-containing protein/CBS domain-containing protein
MNHPEIASSIMFKGMLEKNKALTKHVFSHTLRRFLPPDALGVLQEEAEDSGLCLVTLGMPDSILRSGASGPSQGRFVMECLVEAARLALRHEAPQCRPVALFTAGPSQAVLAAAIPKDSEAAVIRAYPAIRRETLRAAKSQAFGPDAKGPRLTVGISPIEIPRDDNPESLDMAVLTAFLRAARYGEEDTEQTLEDRAKRHELFLSIMRGRQVEPVYQPIVDFASGAVLGYEAFLRGPTDTPFHDPLALLSFAESIGQVFPLERLFFETAIIRLDSLPTNQQLFINIHPASFTDPLFTPAGIPEFLAGHGLSPENLVFEFTERQTPEDLDILQQKLEMYRDKGIRVAMDDIGAGNMTLRALCRIRPDYIKADVSVIGGIQSNPINRVMMETLVCLAEKIKGRVIAVGIESETELTSLASMGVQAGQGYYFSRPGFPKPEITPRIPALVSLSDVGRGELKCSTPVKSLIQETLVVGPATTIREVKKLLEDRPPMANVVIVDGKRPLGIIMNYNLDRHLSTQFGLSLYSDRKVLKLMDRDPLIVDGDRPLEEVASLAMRRDSRKIYDDILVTEGGAFVGTVSVQTMLDSMARVQVELAKGANPLTGLAGNVAIEAEINRRCREGLPSSLIYVDLDNFKVYNDVYGFKSGDKAILLTAEVLREAVARHGEPDDFIGHVGGDDFIIMCGQDRAEDICRTTCERFAAEVPDLYNPEDRSRGFIVGRGRDGREGEFPLVSLSLGYLDCAFAHPFTMEELSQRVAEVKKYAKSRPGNSYVQDRRAPLGSVPTR